MRLCERRLIAASLEPRMEVVGPLGSRPEAFSGEKLPFRAALLDEDGGVVTGQRGLKSGGRIRLLAPADLVCRVGDGVWVDDDFYVIHSISRWTAHRELVCEARA